jgi:hypothetical protein
MPTIRGVDEGVNERKGNDPMSDRDPVAAGRTAPKGQSGHYVAAPLGSLRSGLLQFVSGASKVTVHADPSMEDLYRARLEGQGARGHRKYRVPSFPVPRTAVLLGQEGHRLGLNDVLAALKRASRDLATFLFVSVLLDGHGPLQYASRRTTKERETACHSP